MEPRPLIVTLLMDGASFALLDSLRQLHFPRERNHVPAHITLFHRLPGDEHRTIEAALRERCAAEPPLALTVTGVRSLGRGVAFMLSSPELAALRQALADGWQGWLTPQDRQRFQPHVTIQNKVTEDEARKLHQFMARGFEPFEIVGEGLQLWRYLGGPWELVRSLPFGAAP